MTRLFLWVAPLSYGGYGIVMVVNAAFNGLGKPMPGVAISTLRVLAIYVPLAFLGKALFDVVGIFLAYALANVVSGVVGYLWARSTTHRLAIPKVHADTA